MLKNPPRRELSDRDLDTYGSFGAVGVGPDGTAGLRRRPAKDSPPPTSSMSAPAIPRTNGIVCLTIVMPSALPLVYDARSATDAAVCP